MAFDVNTITVQGAIAIASATAGNKLVIDGCDAVTSIYTQAQAVQIASRPATPDSTTTSIALAGSTENHVYAYASFIQGETGQPGGDVHSFLLYGHSENTPNVVVVVAVASSTEPVHLPEPGDVTNRTEVQFELSFSATDEVVTVAGTSMYTTRGEFLLLKNRTVTTHAEGETTVGDDQTIYGDKTFADGLSISTLSGIGTNPIILASSIIPSGISAKLGAGDHMFSEAFVHYITGVADATRGTCYSYCGSGGVGSTYSMNWYVQSEHKSLEAKIYLSTEDESGTATKEVAGIRLRDNNSMKAQMELTYNKAQDNGIVSCAAKAGSSTEATLRLDALSNNPQFVVDMTVESGDRVAMLCLNSDCELYLDSDLGPTRLGKASNPIDYVIAHNLTAKDNVYVYSQNANNTTAATIILNSQTTNEPYAAVQLEDNSGYVLADVTLDTDMAEAECYLSMYSDNYETCIGKPAKKIDHIYAKNLDGVLVHPTSHSADPPVGSIVMLQVRDSDTSHYIEVGDTLQGSSTRTFRLSIWDADSNSFAGYPNAISNTCKFSALCGGRPKLVQGDAYYSFVLAIRTK